MELQDFIEKFAEALDMDDVSVIDSATRFRELPQWGSLAYLSVRVMVADEYGVQIGREQFGKLVTVGDLAACIKGAG